MTASNAPCRISTQTTPLFQTNITPCFLAPAKSRRPQQTATSGGRFLSAPRHAIFSLHLRPIRVWTPLSVVHFRLIRVFRVGLRERRNFGRFLTPNVPWKPSGFLSGPPIPRLKKHAKMAVALPVLRNFRRQRICAMVIRYYCKTFYKLHPKPFDRPAHPLLSMGVA
jgi:hypothetical protein